MTLQQRNPFRIMGPHGLIIRAITSMAEHKRHPFEDVFFLLKMVDFAFVMLGLSREKKTGVIFQIRGMKTVY